MSKENQQLKNKEKSVFKRTGRRNSMLIGVATALVLLFVVYMNDKSDVPTYAEYGIHMALDITMLQSDAPESSLAEQAFNDKDYATAAQYLKILKDTNPDNKIIQLYYGITLLEIDKIATATTVFSAISSGDTPLNYTAQWYTALGYLKAGKIDWCISVLQEIPSGAAEFNKAQALLARL